jgi:transcriptional regulator with XRE-family HTH domain
LTFLETADNINIMEGIGERLKQIRKSAGLNQGEFAKRIGISQSMLSGIELEREIFSERNFKLICLEFGVDQNWLRTGQGSMFSSPPDPPPSASPVIIDGQELPTEAIELLHLYDQLESPETRKDVRDYAKEKLELQRLRKHIKAEKGEREDSLGIGPQEKDGDAK